MSHYLLVTSLVAPLLLVACAPSAPLVQEPEPTVVAVSTLPVPPTQAVLPFLPATYRDETNGFELEYPANWSVDPDTQIGPRGSEALLLSPGTTAEMLAEGGSLLSITLFDWDPKGDLGAYIAQRRMAWEASGFKISDGSLTQLMDGQPASDFFIEPPDGVLSYFLVTTSGEKYLQLAGVGDLDLVQVIARTLRPLSNLP